MKQLTPIIIGLLLFACKGEVKNQQQETPAVVEETVTETPLLKEELIENSVDDALAKNIANALINEHLKSDIKILTESDRKFQLYKTDLNNDGKNETFVRLMSPYFCGSGGCTFLLLDNLGELITKFTVTRPPFFIESSMENGWKTLLVKDADVFKALIYDNGTYPSNPSLVEKAPYDAPSGHAEVVFDVVANNSKTYTF